MSNTLIKLERKGHIATVTLNRPEKLNALTPVMLDTLEKCARELEADSSIRVVVLTATEIGEHTSEPSHSIASRMPSSA